MPSQTQPGAVSPPDLSVIAYSESKYVKLGNTGAIAEFSLLVRTSPAQLKKTVAGVFCGSVRSFFEV